jgi:hypothetical protein
MKHRESCVLIREPAQSLEGDESVRSDKHESLQPVAYAGKSKLATIWADAIFNFKVAGLHSDLDSKASEC